VGWLAGMYTVGRLAGVLLGAAVGFMVGPAAQKKKYLKSNTMSDN